jgi:hypothetical protein
VSYNLIIAGSRHFTHPRFYAVVEHGVSVFRETFGVHGPLTVFSGKAEGIDTHGEAYAKAHGWDVKPFEADWTLRKKAGPLRNQKMIDAGAQGAVIICLDDSRGSRDMLNRAKAADLNVIAMTYQRHKDGKTFNSKYGVWL